MSRFDTSIRRRTLLKAGAALGASQVIAAPFVVTALGDEPVKIGMVNPLTGVLSALAQSEVDGAKYAEAEINKKGGILGRQVQLLVEDSANDVGTGVQKTRKLIDRDQVDVILGDVNSGIAYAMSQVTFEKKVLHIVPGGHTDPITGTNCKWNVFRVCNTTSMDANAVTPELVKRFGKKWFFITPDYAYGHTLQDGFIKALTKLGGTYDGDYLPINNTDFSATLIKAKAYKPNVLLNNMGGTAGYMTHAGMPPALIYPGLIVSVVVELGLALLVMIGYRARLAAFVMFLWFIPVTIMFHFLPYRAAVAAGDKMAAMGQQINFMKNISIMGGLLLVTSFGSGAWSVDGGK